MLTGVVVIASNLVTTTAGLYRQLSPAISQISAAGLAERLGVNEHGEPKHAARARPRNKYQSSAAGARHGMAHAGGLANFLKGTTQCKGVLKLAAMAYGLKAGE